VSPLSGIADPAVVVIGAGYVVEGLLAHCPTPVAVVPTHRH
jgi:hypothetical protein